MAQHSVFEMQTVYRRCPHGLKFKARFRWRYCDFGGKMPQHLPAHAIMQLMSLCMGAEAMLDMLQAVGYIEICSDTIVDDSPDRPTSAGLCAPLLSTGR